MLILKNVNKNYSSSEQIIHVLKNINLEVKKGEFIAIMGPSGSGKSTLLGVAAGLDKPDTGEVLIDGEDITTLKDNTLAKLRGQKIGFIFQNFQLVKTLNALENVSLPMMISSNLKEDEIHEKAFSLLQKVSLEKRIHHFPGQLSGGEEQRVAIARSFINNPKILFADEPTGNLDAKNGTIIMDMLVELNKQNGSTLIIVTHDPKVASLADRIIRMDNGELTEEANIPSEKEPISRKTRKKAAK